MVMPSIKKWSLRSIDINKQSAANILKQIANCQFSNLQVLSLQANHIGSIEGLCRVEMPLLESFHPCKLELNQAITISAVGGT